MDLEIIFEVEPENVEVVGLVVHDEDDAGAFQIGTGQCHQLNRKPSLEQVDRPVPERLSGEGVPRKRSDRLRPECYASLR